MVCTTLSFIKMKKVPTIIESEVNGLLKDGGFKFAIQNECPRSGRIDFHIFTEGKGGGLAAKVFRDTREQDLDKRVNEFLAGPVKMKFATRTGYGNTLLATIFYEQVEEKK